jgi:hypothetical protein
MERYRPKRLQSKIISSAPPPHWRLFGRPDILEPEEAEVYEALHARIRLAVKPVDIIEEMFVADIAWLECEVLKWRRLKEGLIRARGVKALEHFVCVQLEENDENYKLYSEQFVNRLAEILQECLGGQAENARRLANKCGDNQREAVDKVPQILGDGI